MKNFGKNKKEVNKEKLLENLDKESKKNKKNSKFQELEKVDEGFVEAELDDEDADEFHEETTEMELWQGQEMDDFEDIDLEDNK
ncbi:hypothetical protein [Metamycoplasma neophronis]|uniref:Uncharacterized protein n=1 Tax=Metamycoplasma neophronis TaxID=872983 RepID=A0ABY2YZR1_9BACT|nr:hypothetical protein [Metamycoplasma neophronis]TPR53849.1 hypothetical protein FJR74_01640 [Metamycoplasma neophronis]